MNNETPYKPSEESVLGVKPDRAQRRRLARADLKASKQSFGAQLPYSYVLLKDGRQVELRRSMTQLKELRARKEPIILVLENGSQKIAIPWKSIEKISSKQF